MSFLQLSGFTLRFLILICGVLICSLIVASDIGNNNFDTDFYSLLGVSKKSSLKEIKDAFKIEAKKW